MNFGTQTVTLVTVTENPAVRDRYNNPTLVRSETPIPGCRIRPLTAKEKIELGVQTIEDPWRWTSPPNATLEGAIPSEGVQYEVKHNGMTFNIVGQPRPFPGPFTSETFKITTICERVDG